MKDEARFAIFLILGLSFLVYICPLNVVHSAKIQSGVTIKAPTTNETAPTTNEICNNGIDDNSNGAIDEVTCLPPATETCGLQIVSGAPINYGQLAPGQPSGDKQVMIKNTGNSQTPAKFTIKGGNWVNDVTGATISGPEVTHAAIAPVDFSNKKALSLGGWELGQMAGGQTVPVYLQFLAWVNSPSGSFHQDVTIDLLC